MKSLLDVPFLKEFPIIYKTLLNPIDISIVIVNYNVKALLEQTILSVYKSKNNLNIEIIVVDNQSMDGSCEMIKQKFKEIILIENKENVGFSKANNQGIAVANGKAVLILNPDTVLREDTLKICYEKLYSKDKIGALGVRMIDGSGKFLPESKRGLPTPKVALFKMLGLSKIFPNAKNFGKYHLTYLSEFENHEVEVLSGAFMMIKKEVLEKTGYFDETFFMYGEDIDLSYRITQKGYKNLYVADTSIIHYKGESTKKISVNYVKVFYNAMAIFAKKHFSKNQSWLFSFIIFIAIWFRAAIAMFNRILKLSWLPLLDFSLIYVGCYAAMRYWEIYNKFVVGGYYPPIYYQIHIPVYILVIILVKILFGSYQSRFNLSKNARNVIWGSILLVFIYALLPESFRFSRALILIYSIWALLCVVIIRLILHFLVFKHFDTQLSQINRIAIVGSLKEGERVEKILKNNIQTYQFVGLIKPKQNKEEGDWIGNFENLIAISQLYNVNEIIFCAANVSTQEIMAVMNMEKTQDLRFKIVSESSDSIIGSHDKNSTGEIYSIETPLKLKELKSQKLIFDKLFAFLFIILTPILIFRNSFRKLILPNIFIVFLGRKTWVGYLTNNEKNQLPSLPKSVFNTQNLIKDSEHNKIDIFQIDYIYALNYNINKDILILMRNIF